MNKILIAIFRVEATSASDNFMQVLNPVQIGIWTCCFLWREENQNTQKNLGEGKNQQKTQPTYGTGPMQRTIVHADSDLQGCQ